MARPGATQPPKDLNQSVGHDAGHLFIISAPSGAGKSTLCEALRRHFNDLVYSISYTTRPMRPGEQEGCDYYFISEDEFKDGIHQNRWAEWAVVHGNYYGTSAQWIERTLAAGQDILMDIDVQGTRQILERFVQAVTIFIMPPSLAELERRLVRRGQDDQATIDLRMENAMAEMAQRDLYQHVLVNADLDTAVQQLIGLIHHCRSAIQ